MKLAQIIAAAGLVLQLCTPASLFAAEECSKLGGTCRPACAGGEAAEAGAFLDCTDREECCVQDEAAPAPVKCCVQSFAPLQAGPLNCSEPVQAACPEGVGSPLACAQLKYCK